MNNDVDHNVIFISSSLSQFFIVTFPPAIFLSSSFMSIYSHPPVFLSSLISSSHFPDFLFLFISSLYPCLSSFFFLLYFTPTDSPLSFSQNSPLSFLSSLIFYQNPSLSLSPCLLFPCLCRLISTCVYVCMFFPLLIILLLTFNAISLSLFLSLSLSLSIYLSIYLSICLCIFLSD
ncbi:unnamed protein product [Acanthosepion pharaonis]|uniref:Uncharacterized protein n=1 Tax=Acanthosepion pharaonis TaxID=158019 RepID=A0A812EKP1_ACAPH|nr:unnamed protein product [Sepia pharaonis]